MRFEKKSYITTTDTAHQFLLINVFKNKTVPIFKSERPLSCCAEEGTRTPTP